MPADVAQRFLDDAIQMDRGIRRQVPDRPAAHELRRDPMLPAELIDVPGDCLFESEVVEDDRMQQPRRRPDPLQRLLGDRLNFFDVLDQTPQCLMLVLRTSGLRGGGVFGGTRGPRSPG